MARERYYKARDANEGLMSRDMIPMDLTRIFIGSTPHDSFKKNYKKSIDMTNSALHKRLGELHRKGDTKKLAPYLYDARRRGMELPVAIQDNYSAPDEDYLKEIGTISSVPSSRYVNAIMTASGAITGHAGLDLLQEALRKKSPSHAKGFRIIEDSAEKAVQRFIKGKKGKAVEALFTRPASSVLGKGNEKATRLMGRLIGGAQSAPLAAMAAVPLLSTRVTKKLKGDDKSSKRHKAFDWVEKNPAATVGAMFAPVAGKTMYGGYKDMARSIAGGKKIGQSALKSMGKSLARSGISLGKVGLGAAVPISYISMRKHMQKARDQERSLIEKKLKIPKEDNT